MSLPPDRGVGATALPRCGPQLKRVSAAPINFPFPQPHAFDTGRAREGRARKALAHPQQRDSVDCPVALSRSQVATGRLLHPCRFSAHFYEKGSGLATATLCKDGSSVSTPLPTVATALIPRTTSLSRIVAWSRIVVASLLRNLRLHSAISTHDYSAAYCCLLGQFTLTLLRASPSDCTSRRLNPTFNRSPRLTGRRDRGLRSVGSLTGTRTGYASGAVACSPPRLRTTASTPGAGRQV